MATTTTVRAITGANPGLRARTQLALAGQLNLSAREADSALAARAAEAALWFERRRAALAGGYAPLAPEPAQHRVLSPRARGEAAYGPLAEATCCARYAQHVARETGARLVLRTSRVAAQLEALAASVGTALDAVPVAIPLTTVGEVAARRKTRRSRRGGRR